MNSISNTKFSNLKLIFYKHSIIFPLLFSLLILFTKDFNNHGDQNFFFKTYHEFSQLNFNQVFSHWFNGEIIIDYSSSEDLFKLFLFFFSKINLDFNLLCLIVNFLFFRSFFLIIETNKVQKYLVVLLFLSNFYITSLGYASIKNSLAICLFFYSFYYYRKSNQILFLIFYVLSVSISIYLSILYVMLLILYFDRAKIFFKKNYLLKLLILILPILINGNLAIGKFVGYNTHEGEHAHLSEAQRGINGNLTYELKNKIKKEPGYLNIITEQLTTLRIIKLFKITADFVPERYSNINDRQLYITLSILDILKYLVFSFLIYFTLEDKKPKKYFFYFLIFTLLFFTTVNFERFTLILYIIFIINIAFLDEVIKKNSLKYFIILLFCTYGFLKTGLLFANLILFNEVY